MKRVLLGVLALLCPLVVWAQNPGPNSTANIFTLDNASGGTTQYLLAKIDSTGKVVKALTSDTGIKLYVVASGAGTTGSARLVLSGYTSCIFDATNASGVGAYYVVASTTVAGQCHAQVSPPANGMVVGMMAQQSTTNGATAKILAENTAYVPGTGGAGSGTVQSGVDKSIACYAGTGTEVNDCVPAAANNLYIKWSGGSAINSTLAAAGIGVCTNQVATALNADAAPTCTTITSAYVNNTIALTGTDINTSSQITKASTSFAFPGDITPTTLSGSVNDYNPTNFATNTVLRINGGAADRDITGLTAGTDGDLKVLINIGTTNALFLRNEHTSSSAANRFRFTAGQTAGTNVPGAVRLGPGDSLAVIYDTTAAVWRPFSIGDLRKHDYKIWTIPFGSMASDAPPLVADDDLPRIVKNIFGRPIIVVAAFCEVNAGTVTVNPILTGGTATSILSAACTCGAAADAACSVTGTPTINSYTISSSTLSCTSTPCTADVNLTTVDGVAKYGSITLVGTVE